MSQETYDLVQFILGLLVIVYGVLMMACPKVIVKKEFRDNAKQLSKMRVAGIIIVVCGVAMLILNNM